MKKRTFYTTLLLFLIFMNGILFTIISFMLKDRISNLKEWSLSEYYVIAVMMQNDMQALTDREIYSEENVLLSLQQYSDILRHQNSCVVLFDGNTVIFQNKASDLAESQEIVSLAYDSALAKDNSEYADAAMQFVKDKGLLKTEPVRVEYNGQGYQGNDPEITFYVYGADGEKVLVSFSRYNKSFKGLITQSSLQITEKALESLQRK